MKPLDWNRLQKRQRGRLPHWEIPEMAVFITYRLADSLPKSVVDAYRIERKILDRQYRLTPHDPEIRRARTRLFAQRIDRLLDDGVGSCFLAQHEAASLVQENLQHHNGRLYDLHSSVIMPNHVHVVATLREDVTLAKVTHAWKSYTGKELPKLGGPTPAWQDECYDHIIRDEFEFRSLQRYVLGNPSKANLFNWPWVYEREGWEEELEVGHAGEPPTPQGLL